MITHFKPFTKRINDLKAKIELPNEKRGTIIALISLSLVLSGLARASLINGKLLHKLNARKRHNFDKKNRV